MSKFGEAYRAGQQAWDQRPGGTGILKDPAGSEADRERLLAM